jgi:hypothetical protein
VSLAIKTKGTLIYADLFFKISVAVPFEEIMSFISEISAIVRPINTVSWERREYSSPNRLWLAIFHDPYEWHMGAPGWQLSVISSKTGSAITIPEINKLSEDKGLVCPLDHSPWSANIKILDLNFWESGLVFFDPLSNVCQVKNLFPYIIQWSPTINYLLVFINGRFAILDDIGNILTRIDWKTAEHTLPRVGWMASGKIFFIIGRSSKRSKSRITFFNAENGTMISNEFLDPGKLVPYDYSEYKSIPRGRY